MKIGSLSVQAVPSPARFFGASKEPMNDVLNFRLHQAALDAVGSSLVVLDHEGLIVEVNRSWLQFGHDNGLLPGHASVGSNYLDVCEAAVSADGNAAAQGIRKVIAGEVSSYAQLYACHSPQEERWFQLQVTSFAHAPFLMLIHQNVTVLQAAQQQAQTYGTLVMNILESIKEACLSVDRDWRLLYLNSQMEALLGRSRKELQGQSLWAALPEVAETSFHSRIHTAVREQRAVRFEVFVTASQAWFEVRLYPYATGLTIHFENIKAKKEEEELHTNRNAILEMTAQGVDLSVILQRVAMMLERQWPAYACLIMLNEKGRLFTAAAPGLPAGFCQALDGLEIREGAGICAAAAVRNELVVAEDVANDPLCAEHLNLLRANGLCSCAALPIIGGVESVLGTISLYGRAPGPFPAQLLRDLQRASDLAAVTTEHSLVSEQMIHQAKYDALTGLANRVLFAEQLEEAVQIALKTEIPMALLFIDINGFKSVNDALGHLAGDQVLRTIAERFLKCMRRGELLSRISGDEFTVILPFTNQLNAVQVAQRCLASFALPFVAAEQEFYLSASIGISLMPEAGRSAATLTHNADVAMYHAKSHELGIMVWSASQEWTVAE